jgi:serine phosphatase RsbU (regulator of sigma subunit)
MPIGLYQDEEISFSNKDLIFNEGDLLYLFSDGYIDQFGGSDRKTFRSDNFKKILLKIKDLPLIEQKKYLIKQYEEWKGGIEQTDDILIVGIKL